MYVIYVYTYVYIYIIAAIYYKSYNTSEKKSNIVLVYRIDHTLYDIIVCVMEYKDMYNIFLHITLWYPTDTIMVISVPTIL